MVTRFFLLQIFFAISVYCKAQPGFIPQSGRASAHLKSLGDFMRIELLDRKDLPNENRVYHYRLIFRNEPEELLITITKDNKISAIEGRE